MCLHAVAETRVLSQVRDCDLKLGNFSSFDVRGSVYNAICALIDPVQLPKLLHAAAGGDYGVAATRRRVRSKALGSAHAVHAQVSRLWAFSNGIAYCCGYPTV